MTYVKRTRQAFEMPLSPRGQQIWEISRAILEDGLILEEMEVHPLNPLDARLPVTLSPEYQQLQNEIDAGLIPLVWAIARPVPRFRPLPAPLLPNTNPIARPLPAPLLPNTYPIARPLPAPRLPNTNPIARPLPAPRLPNTNPPEGGKAGQDHPNMQTGTINKPTARPLPAPLLPNTNTTSHDPSPLHTLPPAGAESGREHTDETPNTKKAQTGTKRQPVLSGGKSSDVDSSEDSSEDSESSSEDDEQPNVDQTKARLPQTSAQTSKKAAKKDDNPDDSYDSMDGNGGEETSASDGDEEMDPTETPIMKLNMANKQTRRQKGGKLSSAKWRSGQHTKKAVDILRAEQRGLLFTFTPPRLRQTERLSNISVNGKWGFYMKSGERIRCPAQQCAEVRPSAPKRKLLEANDDL